MGAMRLCLAGLLPGFGQDCIDCTQRESGTLRDFSRSDSSMPVQREDLLDSLFRKGRSAEYSAFGSRYLKPSNGSFGYSCSFLLCERGEHRNHHVLERSS